MTNGYIVLDIEARGLTQKNGDKTMGYLHNGCGGGDTPVQICTECGSEFESYSEGLCESCAEQEHKDLMIKLESYDSEFDQLLESKDYEGAYALLPNPCFLKDHNGGSKRVPRPSFTKFYEGAVTYLAQYAPSED